MTRTFAGPGGSRVCYEPADALPLVHLSVSLRTGSVFDPAGREGLSRLAARLLRMGTRRLGAEALEDRIDALGGHLGISVGFAYTHISGMVVARNVEPFCALIAEVLREPALRAKDLGLLKRETLAALESLQDDDGTLAGRCFRMSALPGHPYGRAVSGTPATIRRIARRDIVELRDRQLVGSNVIFGLSGPLSEDDTRALWARHFGWLPRGKRPVTRVPAPKFASGRRLVIVDKPDRTQTQVLIGTLGSRARDADHVPLLVANTAFGGLFTSRLTTEVRAKRGWSYGASSGLGQQPQRDLWSMRTAPAARDAAACIELQLGLLNDLAAKPLKAKELRAAKNYLEKSVPFESDTASKRLDLAIDQILYELPADYREAFVPNLRKVTRGSAHQAVKRRISTRDQLIVVVATARELLPQLEQLPRLKDVEVVPFDRV